MTNPEFGPPTEAQYERMKGEEAVALLAAALDPVAAKMVDLAHNVVFSDADRHVPEAMLQDLYAAVDAAIGFPIQGKTREYNKYIVTIEGNTKIGVLPYRRHFDYPFEGVLDGIGRVAMNQSDGKTFEQLCLIVNPLHMLRDGALSRDYINKGWSARLLHPFADEEHTDKPIHLPLNIIRAGTVRVLDDWKIS